MIVNNKSDDNIFYILNKQKVVAMQTDEKEERLINIEIALANHEKTIDELNSVIIEQGKIIEKLVRQNQYLFNLIENDAVKPQSEETPPPHY